MDHTLAFIDAQFKEARAVNHDEADNYRKLWELRQPELKRLEGQYGKTKSGTAPVDMPLMTMDWAQYLGLVKADKIHNFNDRLELLSIVRKLFTRSPRFSDMSQQERKAVAGMDSKIAKDAKWFGSMMGVGYFQQAINNNNVHLSNALDRIPLTGEVSKPQYDAFIEEYVKAFPNGRDGIGTSSRLATHISAALARSGYLVSATSSDSGYPVYEVVEQRALVSGAMKNLIFASTGPKPELVFRDAINNDVEITKNAEHVLVYDIPLPAQGALEWKHLRDWWAAAHTTTAEEAKTQLYSRLNQSVRSAKSPGEYAVFRTYYKLYAPLLGDKLPALLPQVFLHYDPYTKRQRGDEQFLARQRMDFLLMLEHGVRVVIEVDGRQHYANDDGKGRWLANAQLYAEMASEDRRTSWTTTSDMHCPSSQGLPCSKNWMLDRQFR